MDPVEAELDQLRAQGVAAMERVRELLAARAVGGPRAQALAAQILALADDVATVRLAHDLALQAMRRHRPARRLAAVCFDRLRVLAGAPQKFGTQRRPDGTPFPIDPATTDSERAKWDVEPLGRRGDPRGGPQGG